MFSQYHLPSRFGRALARLRSKHRARCIRDAKDFLARAAQTPTPSRMGPSFTNKSWIKQAGLESVVDYLIEVSAEKWADSVCRLLAWIWIVTLGLKWRRFRTKKNQPICLFAKSELWVHAQKHPPNSYGDHRFQWKLALYRELVCHPVVFEHLVNVYSPKDVAELLAYFLSFEIESCQKNQNL